MFSVTERHYRLALQMYLDDKIINFKAAALSGMENYMLYFGRL